MTGGSCVVAPPTRDAAIDAGGFRELRESRPSTEPGNRRPGRYADSGNDRWRLRVYFPPASRPGPPGMSKDLRRCRPGAQLRPRAAVDATRAGRHLPHRAIAEDVDIPAATKSPDSVPPVMLDRHLSTVDRFRATGVGRYRDGRYGNDAIGRRNADRDSGVGSGPLRPGYHWSHHRARFVGCAPVFTASLVHLWRYGGRLFTPGRIRHVCDLHDDASHGRRRLGCGTSPIILVRQRVRSAADQDPVGYRPPPSRYRARRPRR